MFTFHECVRLSIFFLFALEHSFGLFSRTSSAAACRLLSLSLHRFGFSLFSNQLLWLLFHLALLLFWPIAFEWIACCSSAHCFQIRNWTLTWCLPGNTHAFFNSSDTPSMPVVYQVIFMTTLFFRSLLLSFFSGVCYLYWYDFEWTVMIELTDLIVVVDGTVYSTGVNDSRLDSLTTESMMTSFLNCPPFFFKSFFSWNIPTHIDTHTHTLLLSPASGRFIWTETDDVISN